MRDVRLNKTDDRRGGFLLFDAEDFRGNRDEQQDQRKQREKRVISKRRGALFAVGLGIFIKRQPHDSCRALQPRDANGVDHAVHGAELGAY